MARIIYTEQNLNMVPSVSEIPHRGQYGTYICIVLYSSSNITYGK